MPVDRKAITAQAMATGMGTAMAMVRVTAKVRATQTVVRRFETGSAEPGHKKPSLPKASLFGRTNPPHGETSRHSWACLLTVQERGNTITSDTVARETCFARARSRS